MLSNIEAVIFDLDGTLVDSNGIWEDIDKEFMAVRGLSMPENMADLIDGMSYKQVAHWFKEYFNLAETPEELMDIWNDMALKQYENDILPKKGAVEFMEYLSNKNIKISIASSNALPMINAVLKKHNMDKFVDVIITSDELGTGKDNPTVYLEAAKRLNVDPEKCMVFEDIVPGIEACNSVNMKTCAIYDSHYYSDDYEKEKERIADIYIRDFTELDMK